MDEGAGLRCDAPEPDATACKTMVYSEVDSPMRRSIAPSVRGAHPEGHCPATLTNEPAPSGRGAHPKGHCLSTLTNEPAPSGRLAHPKSHRASTLTNEPAQLGRGASWAIDAGDPLVKPKGTRAYHHGCIRTNKFFGFLDFLVLLLRVRAPTPPGLGVGHLAPYRSDFALTTT